mmetsp:Transcript_37635/g.93559  ORF Transcript_37635/g.93559 Transcript_37635/m.93559 type:complete len:307 (-) Transcript_37635:1396-2316(-)
MCAWIGETSYEMISEGSVSRVRAWLVAVNWNVSSTRCVIEVETWTDVGIMLMWCSCVSCGWVETKCFPSRVVRDARTDSGSKLRSTKLSSSPNDRWSMWCDVLTDEKSNEWRPECGATCSVPGARLTSMYPKIWQPSWVSCSGHGSAASPPPASAAPGWLAAELSSPSTTSADFSVSAWLSASSSPTPTAPITRATSSWRTPLAPVIERTAASICASSSRSSCTSSSALSASSDQSSSSPCSRRSITTFRSFEMCEICSVYFLRSSGGNSCILATTTSAVSLTRWSQSTFASRPYSYASKARIEPR